MWLSWADNVVVLDTQKQEIERGYRYPIPSFSVLKKQQGKKDDEKKNEE